MKLPSKKIVTAVCVGLAAFTLSATAFAGNEAMKFKVNGESKQIEGVKKIDNLNYVTIRSLAAALGIQVKYNAGSGEVDLMLPQAAAHDHANSAPPASAKKPSLDVLAVQHGKTLDFSITTDLTISAEHYGKEHASGEGHAHIYVDGVKAAGVKQSAYSLDISALSPGKHKIDVTLQQNDHQDYGVSRSFEIDVQPWLDAELKQEGKDATITWNTNLAISADHYGKDPVEGEGHAHVYVDGKKVTGLKTKEPYTVKDLKIGTHSITIELQQNNHTSYSIVRAFNVEVK